MRCPSCQNDIPDNQFYCPICRASVYSYVPESTQKKGGKLERAGRRLLDLLILVALVGAAVFLARQIEWNELLGLKPATETSSPAKTERKQNQAAATSPNSQKKSEASTPSTSSDEMENAKESKPKSEDPPATTEPKATPKPAATATPKPANSGETDLF